MANRTTLNKEQKIALITYKNTNPSTSNVDLSKWIKQSYNLVVHPSTIGRILKRKIDDIVGMVLQRDKKLFDIQNWRMHY